VPELPPVPLDVPAPPDAEVPPELAPLPLAPPVPLAAPDPPEAAEPPAEDAGELLGADAAALVVLGVEDVVEVVLVATVAALAEAPVGTVRGGAPVVSAEVEPPPPHAARPIARPRTATIAASERERADAPGPGCTLARGSCEPRKSMGTGLSRRADSSAGHSADSRSGPFG